MTLSGPNQQPTYVQMVRPPSNGMAVAGLVLGIVAIVLAIIPLVGLVLVWLPGLLAIIFGAIGLGAARQLRGLGRQAAGWALGLGIAAGPVALMVLPVLGAMSDR